MDLRSRSGQEVSVQMRLERCEQRSGRRFVIWVACVALLSASAAVAQGFAPVLTVGSGVEVAWLYRTEGLLLAVGEATYVGAGIAMARRAAVLEARGTLLRAFAQLHGAAGTSVSGAIRRQRLVSTEIDDDSVRVYVAALLVDIDLR